MDPSDYIYLDHAATTPVLEEVFAAMEPYLIKQFGNPSAVYAIGREAKNVVEQSRVTVSELLGVTPSEVIFTSGGSESNSTVIGIQQILTKPGIITSKLEHEAILEPCLNTGHHLFVEANSSGAVSPSQFRDMCSDEYGMASFMTINNEIGSVNDVALLSAIAREAGILLHTDAVQAARVLNLKELVSHVDYMTLSGHKIGAPKGVGVLIAKAGRPFKPLVYGGGQERDRRAGTENVAFVAGFARALKIAVRDRVNFVSHARQLGDLLRAELRVSLKDRVQFILEPQKSTPHIVSLLVLNEVGEGLDGEMLILGLDMAGIYVSAGSACSSGTVKKSHVLKAMGVPASHSRGALRVSFGPNTSTQDVRDAVRHITAVADRMSA